jgi:AcrR family transcriptional regulator
VVRHRLAGGLPAAGGGGAGAGPDDEDYPLRLLTAMINRVIQKGYPATTVADVVAAARVSRRTFYEHFANKEECFLATFEYYTGLLTGRLQERLAPVVSWQDRLEAGVASYVGAVLSNPSLTRSLTVEILTVGEVGLDQRRRVYEGWAAMLRREIRLARTHDRALGAVSREPGPALALATIGAVSELVLAAVDEKAPWTAEQLSSAVIDAILTAALVTEEDRQQLLHLEVDLRAPADVPALPRVDAAPQPPH